MLRVAAISAIIGAAALLLPSSLRAASDYNLSLSGTATSSSIQSGRVGSRAANGSRTGTYFQTTIENQPYWEMDLGSVKFIDDILAWNNTHLASDTTDYYVFVSDTPFYTSSISGTLSQAGVTSFHDTGTMGRPATFSVNRTGRYVRVQLNNINQRLTLLEIEVMGDDIFNVNTGAAGTGSGSITSDTGGIACNVTSGSPSGTCSAAYGDFTTVTLTATPSVGSVFSGWTNCTTPVGNSCQHTLVGADASPQANFTLVGRRLTVEGTGTGVGTISSSPGSISCGITDGLASGVCHEDFYEGAVITLTANTTADTDFQGWSGCDAPSGNTCVQTLSGGDETVQAIFDGEAEIDLTGNAVVIVDGDTSPDTNAGTNFGSARLSSGTVTRTFQITNSGTTSLTLGSNAVSISGADAEDFTVVSQPPATIAAGDTGTFTVQFNPSAPGNRSATINISSDDADESNFEFSISGSGTPEASVTIIQSGADNSASVSYSSSTSDLNFTLTGSASQQITTLSAGVYTLAAGDASASGHGLTGISCNDSNSSGDIGTRSLTLDVSDDENLVCTFSFTETSKATSNAIKKQITRRNALRLSHRPNRSRRINRLLNEDLFSRSTGTVSFEGMALASSAPINASVSRNGLSLASVTGDYKFSKFGDDVEFTVAPPRKMNRWGVWTEAKFSLADDKDINSSSYSVIHSGIDYIPNENLLLGVMFQLDEYNESSDSHEISGNGWMTGAYITARLSDNLFLDTQAALGDSNNQISPTGTYEDEFTTKTWLIASSLSGHFDYKDWTFEPSFSYQFIKDTQIGYYDSLGVFIPTQSAAQGEFSFGTRVTHNYEFSDTATIRTWAGGHLNAPLVFDSSKTNTFQSPTGSVEAGVNFKSFSFSLNYQGIGSDYRSYGAAANLNFAL